MSADITHILGDAGDTEPGDLVEPVATDTEVHAALRAPISGGRKVWYELPCYSYGPREEAVAIMRAALQAALSSLRAERDELTEAITRSMHAEARAIVGRRAAEQRVVELREKLDDSETEYLTECRNSQRLDELRAKAEQRVVELEADRARLMSNPQAERYWEARWRDEAERVAALEGALTEARRRVDAARGAIETNQVEDKDAHGTLKACMREIDALLRPTGDGQP